MISSHGTLLVAVLTATSALSAQTGSLQSASGTTSIILERRGLLSVEPKDGNLSFAYKRERSRMDDPKPGAVTAPIRASFVQLSLSGTTQKGKRDLFAAGDIIPGVAADVRFGRRKRQNYIATEQDRGDDGRLIGWYLALGAGYVRNAMATTTDADANVFELKDADGASATVGLGVNYQPSTTGHLFGLGMKAGRSWNVPTATTASNVCVIQRSGADTAGQPTTAATCRDRFLGGTTNATIGQLRFDMVSRRYSFPGSRASAEKARQAKEAIAGFESSIARVRDMLRASTEENARREQDLRRAAGALANGTLQEVPALTSEFGRTYVAVDLVRDRVAQLTTELDQLIRQQNTQAAVLSTPDALPSVGFTAAAVLGFKDGAKTTHNVAFGPVLYAPMQPLSAVVAVLAEVQDATNALGQSPAFSDRFAVRLYIGVPLF